MQPYGYCICKDKNVVTYRWIVKCVLLVSVLCQIGFEQVSSFDQPFFHHGLKIRNRRCLTMSCLSVCGFKARTVKLELYHKKWMSFYTQLELSTINKWNHLIAFLASLDHWNSAILLLWIVLISFFYYLYFLRIPKGLISVIKSLCDWSHLYRVPQWVFGINGLDHFTTN